MIELLGAALDVLQLAHDTQMPHQEPVRSSGGGASPIVIAAAVAATLVAVVGLLWLKKRVEGEPGTIQGEEPT